MIKNIVVGSLLWLASTSALASDAKALTEQLSQLNTFMGAFEQTLVDDKGEQLQSSTGDFFLQRPGYFRWETKAPFPQLLVSDLQSIWLYDPDLEQVSVRNYDDRLSATPALLLSGDVNQVTEHYEIVRESDQRYQLTPKLAHELFDQLIVSFSGDQLESMVLKDALGQTTTFRFIDGIYNQVIPQAMFEFSPPEGTDVIIGN